MRVAVAGLLALTFIAGCGEANRSANVPPATTRTAERDNTAVNTRDRSGDTKTPLDQNENRRDIDITAEVRKRIVGTDMSTDAHNVKIITQDGKVTLRGPVKSDQEKSNIEKIAHDVAGNGNVETQLEVQP